MTKIEARSCPANGIKSTDYVVSRNETEPRLDIVDRMTPSSDRSPTYTSTFYVGEENDPRAMWRIQNKVLDKQNKAAGMREELAEGNKRVRIEVTLGADAPAIVRKD
jgi:hypothetical protein